MTFSASSSSANLAVFRSSSLKTLLSTGFLSVPSSLLRTSIAVASFPRSPAGRPRRTPKSALVFVSWSVRTSSTILFMSAIALRASSSVTWSLNRILALAVASLIRDSRVLGVAPIWSAEPRLLKSR